MEEEREVSTHKIEVPLGRLEVSELTNVHIENVDLDGAAKDVNDGEAEGPHRNAESWDLVFKSVLDSININQG